MPADMITEFVRYETLSGLLLVVAALSAMLLANIGLESTYREIKWLVIEVRAGSWGLQKPVIQWVNEGLMALFFFLVGLEIKRELQGGELSSRERATLPLIAATGGMIVPALIYLAVTAGDADAMRGWAIPAATDIAFALGIMSLLRDRVPASLKVFLMAIAVLDDIGAVIIIALFYSGDLSLPSLAIAAVAAAALFVMNRFGVRRIAPYALLGILMWTAVLESGVHATLAGVVTAAAIPHRNRARSEGSPLEMLEHALHPWVAFGVLPLFGFLNAGVPLAGIGIQSVVEPVTLGVALGLIAGKQVGVFGAALLAVKSGLAAMPRGTNWRQIYGVAALAGIGFTMSLFIGQLAFAGLLREAETRLGVVLASLVSAIWGYSVLRLSVRAAGKRGR
ncbi:MAG: Na+/H+ antiporter NhaA [Alphaproteobacteria bacterium]